MSTVIQDIRYALRAFRRNPGFTAAAVISLALGVGANTSIFSVASALLLRPLPYRDASRLVILWNRSPGLGITEDWFSTAQYFDIKSGHAGFEQVALAIGGNDNLTGGDEPERVGTIHVSANLLPMLGAQAALGRLFTPEEDAAGAAPTAVLGHGTWVRRFGADPHVVGTSIVVNGQSYKVVGVLPASFSLPREVMPTLNGAEDAELVLPLPLGPRAPDIRGREDYNIIGKLKPAITVAKAQAEMDALTARLRREHPDVYPPNGRLTFGIVPLHEQVVGGDVRQSLVVLIGSVSFVLLIACANVANLLLSRALARQREIAVRAALGAGRARIVRQLLTESLLLATAGGLAGLLLAMASVRWIHALGVKSVPRLHEVAVDGRVLLFTLGLSVASGLLFGLAPALRSSRLDLHENLKDASRGSAGVGAVWGRGPNLRRMLVVSELALSVMLLIGAGLLIRSFARLQDVPPGFEPSKVLTLELTMSGRKYSGGPVVIESYRQLWPRIDRLPGVIASGAVSALPLSQMASWGPITIEGRTPAPGEAFINADQRMVAGNYFGAMQIPLRSGRFFDDHDTRESARVTIVDDYMAQQLWPDQEAVGKRLHLGTDPKAPWTTVVGVVGRVKQYTLDSDSRIAMYLAHAQFPIRAMNVVVRSSADPVSLTAGIRKQLHEIDPDLPMYRVRTMDSRVGESLARRRFSMLLLTLFAGLALGLATIGIYGVIAYLVDQGTRELGIRMALGATPRGILVLIVRHGMAVTGAGVTIGLIGAFGLTRLMRSQLFGVSAVDPLTFGGIALLLSAIALLASYVPARRAARIDPMISLRSE